MKSLRNVHRETSIEKRPSRNVHRETSIEKRPSMQPMSNPGTERRNRRLLLSARGIRAFGDGFVSILVPVYLTGLGIGVFEVGVLTTAMLLGSAIMTLTIGLIAHRLRRITLLTGASVLMVLSGIGHAFETEFWPLLVIAAVGTLNPGAMG